MLSRIDLADGFGAGWAHGKPAVLATDLDAANKLVIAGALVSTLVTGSPPSIFILMSSGASALRTDLVFVIGWRVKALDRQDHRIWR